jgi:hypothetical protein
MRKSLWIIVTVLIVGFGLPTARADTFTERTMNFRVTVGPVLDAPTGSFVFDNTTNLFTTFEVIWDGIGFDLAACANGQGEPGGTNECFGTSNGPASFLALTSCETTDCGWYAIVSSQTTDAVFTMGSSQWLISGLSLGVDLDGSAEGTFTVSTFDPGTGILILTGVGLLGLMMQKRPAANG